MLSPTSFFRTALRHAPRLCPSAGINAGASGSRTFSSTAAALEAGSNNTPLYAALDEVQNVYQSQAQLSTGVQTLNTVRIKQEYRNAYFINPSDFGMKARVSVRKPARKPMLLGPPRHEAERLDPFRKLYIDPVDEVFNHKLMAQFVTDMGKIKGRPETRLTWRSQRKVGKAVRRAKHMGIIPWLSKRIDGGQ